jgi:D-alanyl-D-alanine carboxypeptidase
MKRRRPLTRIRMIIRVAVLSLCALLVLLVSIYIFKPELLARAGTEPVEPEKLKEPEGEGKEAAVEDGLLSPWRYPDPDESEELDAPPEEVPDESPERPLEAVDGSNLLALVTKQTSLGRYAPTDLEPIPAEIVHPDRRGSKYYLRCEPLGQLKKMFAAAAEDGVQLTVTSAYRSYDTQESTFNYWVSLDGEEEAQRYSARPGQSEHQLGTTLDFNIDVTAGAEQHAWLADNAHLYGFAMSYPEGAEEVTGYRYEPWHYRYIGVEAAKGWKALGLPLCLYLQQKR